MLFSVSVKKKLKKNSNFATSKPYSLERQIRKSFLKILLIQRKLVKIYQVFISRSSLSKTVSVQNLPSISQTFPAFNPLSANPTKWPNTLKQFVGKLPTNCLSVFGHFVNLALKGLNRMMNQTCSRFIISFNEVKQVENFSFTSPSYQL